MPFHFKECAANLLTNRACDEVAKIPEYKACAVRIEKIERIENQDYIENQDVNRNGVMKPGDPEKTEAEGER